MQHINIDIIEMANGHLQPSWVYFDESKGHERYHEPDCSYCANRQQAIEAARRSIRRIQRRLGSYVAYTRIDGASVEIDRSEDR
ncbi:MAG: hypothetical protein OXF96_06855 [Chloroflexi bacterium]|nr:hypothetical protein [Chloroflexota bacterium]